jgi:DMSO reductase anchor subunit
MLLLTQTAAGVFLVLALAVLTNVSTAEIRTLATAGCLMLHGGLGVSVLHLGRPLGAWRFFLGLRTSWMSREILAFGIFAAAATATAAAAWLIPNRQVLAFLALTTALLGGVGVFTSAMIYVDTRRPFWGGRLTFPKFYGTMLLLGSTTVAGVLACVTGGENLARSAAVIAVLVLTALFLWSSHHFTRATGEPSHPAYQSVRAIRQFRPWIPGARVILFAVSTIGGLVTIVAGNSGVAVLFMASTCAAQIIERYCFFTTCPSPRMPGGVPA